MAEITVFLTEKILIDYFPMVFFWLSHGKTWFDMGKMLKHGKKFPSCKYS